MKIAVVYNRDSQNVINLFGLPNREKIGKQTIRRLVNALKQGGHQVIALEGDKDLVNRLEEFMPRVVHGERPGLVFNVSYGIQGQARYTHIPSILEMVGIPYVASGPLAHSLALDKVVTKIILKQHGLPTPEFAILQSPDDELPDLPFPMVVKPKNESVSFGLAVVHDETELREGARRIFDKFGQAVLVEQYIEGREINVGLLGNNPPEAFPPVELVFGEGQPPIYTYEDKTGKSGRTIEFACPAPIPPDVAATAQDIARRAFMALGIADCARVDMRLDAEGNLYILELNSLPSLGEHGSYLVGAAHVGLDFTAVVNRLVEVACARYFGTPAPPPLESGDVNPERQVFAFITERRERLERYLREWVEINSRTDDPVGIQLALDRARRPFTDVRMRPVDDLPPSADAFTWETQAGMAGGTLLVAHLDVPGASPTHQPFRREPEWVFGEGIATSRAPIVMLETVLRALRSVRRLRHIPLGVLLYTDEGRDAQRSRELIRAAASRVKRVLVLRPGTGDCAVVTQRRGHRSFDVRVAGDPLRPGRAAKRPSVLRWTWERLLEAEGLTSQTDRLSVSTLDVEVERHPMLLPHRARAKLLMTYLDDTLADGAQQELERIFRNGRYKAQVRQVADRPPKREREADKRLLRSLREVADAWQIPLAAESSTWPSVAGLVPPKVACLCGVGPPGHDIGTPGESIRRISLVQRTLMLAQYLLGLAPQGSGR